MIVCDDGLQHGRLPRTIEVVAIDGRHRFGNGFLLPAGPLREPLSRLQQADCVLVKQANGTAKPKEGGVDRHGARHGEHGMHLHPKALIRLYDDSERSPESFQGQKVEAYAGIGHPDSFFQHWNNSA